MKASQRCGAFAFLTTDKWPLSCGPLLLFLDKSRMSRRCDHRNLSNQNIVGFLETDLYAGTIHASYSFSAQHNFGSLVTVCFSRARCDMIERSEGVMPQLCKSLPFASTRMVVKFLLVLFTAGALSAQQQPATAGAPGNSLSPATRVTAATS